MDNGGGWFWIPFYDFERFYSVVRTIMNGEKGIPTLQSFASGRRKRQ